jgi:hypothetical protein
VSEVTIVVAVLVLVIAGAYGLACWAERTPPTQKHNHRGWKSWTNNGSHNRNKIKGQPRRS